MIQARKANSPRCLVGDAWLVSFGGGEDRRARSGTVELDGSGVAATPLDHEDDVGKEPDECEDSEDDDYDSAVGDVHGGFCGCFVETLMF